MSDIFESQLVGFARKAERTKAHCQTEESTRYYLIVPFLSLLGYDATDPAAVVPKLQFPGGATADFAIMRDGSPSIIVETVRPYAPILEARSQLAACFNSTPSVRLAIATSGLAYEFFIDSIRAGTMDAEPFLTLDLDSVAAGSLDAKALRLLSTMRQRHFEPEALVEQAYTALLHKRLRTLLARELRAPSELFCRNLLSQIGIAGMSTGQIDNHFRPIIKAAMEEALVLPVAQALQEEMAEGSGAAAVSGLSGGKPAVPATAEIAVIEHVSRILGAAARTDLERADVVALAVTDYIGRLAIEIGGAKRARLLDYSPLGSGRHRFNFPMLGREQVVEKLADIDATLVEAFRAIADNRAEAA